MTEEAGDSAEGTEEGEGGDEEASRANVVEDMRVTVNGQPITLKGKTAYVFVDVFDYIDFDLSKPKGKSVAAILNGREAQYMETLSPGDRLEVYWRE